MKVQRLFALLALSLLTACGGGDSSSEKAAAPAPAKAKAPSTAPAATTPAAPAAAAVTGADAVAAAAEMFKVRCSTCHGLTGKGDGAAAAAFPVKPRDLTLAEWQSSVTDEHIDKIIKMGGMAVGKSPLMPPNPDLMAPDKAEIVVELRKLVRGLGKAK